LEQILSIGAALTILAAYAGLQLGYLDNKKPLFNWLNFIGAIVLAVIAFRAEQWGFVILEVSWGIISIGPILGLKKASS